MPTCVVIWRDSHSDGDGLGGDGRDGPVTRTLLTGAAGFIDGLPARYNFFLAEGGLGLSGGQKQRVSIARTLYRAPRIVIMDEATSALDAESESMIMRNMKDILKGRTAIIIAHRLSTVRYADRVIVLEEGRIVEDGVHAGLLKKNGYYAQLFGSQIESGAA